MILKNDIKTVIISHVRRTAMERFKKEQYIGSNGISAFDKIFDGFCKTHWHEFYEMEYIIDGSGEYIVDGISHTVSPGMLFFMTPLNFHSVAMSDSHIFNVMFSEKVCDNTFLSDLMEKHPNGVIIVPQQDRSFTEAVFKELSNADRDSSYCEYLLNVILGKLSSYGNKSCRTSPSPLSNTLLFLLNHFRENPSLAEAAEHSGYTPTYFSEIFKRETRETYKNQLDRLRFEYAQKLIKYSDMSVFQICRESGFDDYANFIRRFKKRYGISPREMKLQNNNKS